MQTSTNQTTKVLAINKLSDAKILLEQIGINDVQNAAIVAVDKVEPTKFKSSLLKAANDNNEDAKRFVRRSLCLCTKPVVEAFIKIGAPVNYDILVRKGIEKGKEIRDNLTLAINDTGNEGKIAEQWLKDELTGKVHNLRPVETNEEKPSSEGYESYAPTGDENENTSKDNQRDYRSVHFYGKDYALCFTTSLTRSAKPQHTINIDASKTRAPKDYDWKAATHFQFTPKELHGVNAVLINQAKVVEFKSHGAANDKGFSIERQEGKFFAKVFSKEGGSRGVAIQLHEAVELAILVNDQIHLQNPSYQKPDLITLTRLVIGQRV